MSLTSGHVADDALIRREQAGRENRQGRVLRATDIDGAGKARVAVNDEFVHESEDLENRNGYLLRLAMRKTSEKKTLVAGQVFHDFDVRQAGIDRRLP